MNGQMQSDTVAAAKTAAPSRERTPLYVLAAAAAGMVVLGLAMIVAGTMATSVGRYAAPPEILPGVAVLHLGAGLAALLLASPRECVRLVSRLRDRLTASIDATARQACFSMFVLLAVLQMAMSMVDGHASQANHAHYAVSLAGNILVSLTGASAFAVWFASWLIVRRTGVEPQRRRPPY